MRLASFKVGSTASWGMIDGAMAIDLGAVIGDRFPTLKAWLADGHAEDAHHAALDAPRIPVASISWLPVVPDAGKILCVGHNYEDHRKETGRAKVGFPSIFTRFADTQVGHGQPLRRPAESTSLDFEGELAVVIGKGGRRIAKEQALDHVRGAIAASTTRRSATGSGIRSSSRPGKKFPGYRRIRTVADDGR